jgi:hypothetical protein
MMAATSPDLPSSSPLQPKAWHFVAGSFDNQLLRLYVDGTFMPGLVLSEPRTPVPNCEPLVIGWKYGGIETDHLAGMICEVRIYNRPLSVPELHALFSAGRCTSETPLNSVAAPLLSASEVGTAWRAGVVGETGWPRIIGESAVRCRAICFRPTPLRPIEATSPR